MSKKYKRILTVEDLVQFCRDQKFHRFDSKESGYKLSVQVPATFESTETDDDHRGMMKLKFKVFHTGLNRNGSYVSKEAAEAAMPTIKNRPVLAAIHQLDDGEWDFEGHNIIIVEDENGNLSYEYEERQVGSFAESEPFFEHDDELDKDFICAYAYISEEYTRAADIIRKKNGTKNSVELSIEEMSFNAKDNYLSLDKFFISGSTLLGRRHYDGVEVKEGMLGSRADIADFSEKNNSVFSHDEKVIAMLEEINNKLDDLANFSIDENNQKGGNLVFESLLEKYGKTAEDITFEYESLSDEELEAKFAEMFDVANTDEEGADEPEPTSEDDETIIENHEEDIVEPEVEETPVEETPVEDNFSYKYAITSSTGEVREFELSLDDINYALYNLVNDTYSEQDNCWYGVSVYESHVIMQDWWTGKAYKQSYKREDDNFSLTGDRVEVYSNWLTKEEEAAIAELRSNYSLIESELNTYKLAEENANKDALFTSTDYSAIAESEEFTSLAKDHAEFSLDELKNKLDGMLLDFAKSGNLKFNVADENKSTGKTGLPIKTPSKKNSRYGTLKFN